MTRRGPAPCLGALLLLVALAGCSPAPVPTPAPLPTATVAGPNAGLLELRNRIGLGAGPRSALIQALAEASAGDPAGLAAPAAALVTWAETELAWLDEHPPEPCYAAAHEAYGDALAALASAATAFAEIAEGAEPVDVAGPEAVSALGAATDGIARAEGAALTAGTRCAG